MTTGRVKKVSKRLGAGAKKILKLPVVDLIPLSIKAWESMPEEKKQEVLQNLLIAGAKMAAGGGGKREF